MGYALFAQRKLVLDFQLNNAQLQQTMKANQQLQIATSKLALDKQLSSLKSGQAQELAGYYRELSSTSDSTQRQQINDKIREIEARQEQEVDDINTEIYKVAVEEQAVELEVKRLDTMVTALQKQLEAVEQAEGQAIDRATPKFAGLG
jgi:hypothetical protein